MVTSPGATERPGPPVDPTRYSPDGLWWWDGRRWRPTPVATQVREVSYTPERRWSWDGTQWQAVKGPERRPPPGSIVVHVAFVLALATVYPAMMMLIGVADQVAAGETFGPADALIALFVGAPGYVSGAIALLRLSRRHAPRYGVPLAVLRVEAALAVVIGLASTLVLAMAMFSGP